MTAAERLAMIRAAHRRYRAREGQVERVARFVDYAHAEPVSRRELQALMEIFAPSVEMRAPAWEVA